jgi:hypothetical protein
MVQSGINFGRNTSGNKFDSGMEGRRGWFRIIHLKAVKKVTSILIPRNKNSFLGLQNLEAKEIMKIT